MIIGITGTLAAGKDTIASYLQKKGFVHYSLSNILREELKKQGIEENIDNLLALGNKLRQEFGPGILGRKTLEKIKNNKEKKAIASSIRHPKEIEELRKGRNFVLIAVDAPIKIRYKRIQKRKRAGDQVSFEKFKSQEKSQLKGNGTKAQLSKCIKVADYKIINNKSFENLYQNIDKILKN
ncbi:MAG: AAA family ATPase [Patescibacteria group bacterium]